MSDWKVSTVLMAAGVACTTTGGYLIATQETRLYGIIVFSVGAGLTSGGQYLQGQGLNTPARYP